MALDAPGCEQLVAHLHGEREVREVITVEMPELALADPELDAAEAVRLGRDTAPAADLALDLGREPHTVENARPPRAIPPFDSPSV